jgi:hypothetical protein
MDVARVIVTSKNSGMEDTLALPPKEGEEAFPEPDMHRQVGPYRLLRVIAWGRSGWSSKKSPGASASFDHAEVAGIEAAVYAITRSHRRAGGSNRRHLLRRIPAAVGARRHSRKYGSKVPRLHRR